MADLKLGEIFLTGMTTYGPLTLGVAMLLAPLGIPVPLPFMVLAAGAFARHGSIHWGLALILALTGAALGDSLGYVVGHFASDWAQRRFGESPVWQKARHQFKRNGSLAIFLTRFLLTPLAIPTNLIAGGSRYPFQKFLVYTVAGTLIFLVMFGGLGYIFSNQWHAIGEIVGSYSVWLGGAAIVGVGIFLLVRHLYRNRRSTVTR